MALLINEQLPLPQAVRSAVLLPWIVPTVLSAHGLAVDVRRRTSACSTGSWCNSGLSQSGLPWLTNPDLALFSVILVNAWRGIPFFAITLAGRAADDPDRAVRGDARSTARARWHRFRYVTLPLILPILLITLVLSIIWTFSDFQVVYGLTQGGPMNRRTCWRR